MNKKLKITSMRVGQRLFLKGVPALGSVDTLQFGIDDNGRNKNDIEAYWHPELNLVTIHAEDNKGTKKEIAVPVGNIAYMVFEDMGAIAKSEPKKVEEVKPKVQPKKPTQSKGK